ncbi:S-layer homology domain-containing protein [Paenibacillus sp. V4I5]|uniref:S-layer homology domain-containing protein n=1 Tax=Paenibacillus sp. V4I5 TaxID=3042306 RepID=UPI00278D2617|nr:S-layer homology domain-containing protein [Paenibacillus sp. V4I5]MDQ0917532.1 hypothetical protein [Paenibacillus sp. V4I5]
MKKRWIIAVIAVVTTALVLPVRGSASAMTLVPSSSHASPGDMITLTGSAGSNAWVTIRTLDNYGNIVFFDAVKADALGAYTDSFKVPDTKSGILYFTAGNGSNLAVKNVSVYSDGATYRKPTPVVSATVAVATDGSNKSLGITTETLAVSAPISIDVPGNITDATLNVSELLSAPIAGTLTTGILPTISVSAVTSISTKPVLLSMPNGLTISAPTSGNWDGTVNVPTVKSANTVTLTSDVGTTASVSTVIEVGFGDVPLTLNKAVRLLIPNQAGKQAAYYRGTTFHKITAKLNEDTQNAADQQLNAGADAFIEVGQDLVIWTKHFTRFVTYTQTVISNDSNSSTGGTGQTSAPPQTPTPTATPSPSSSSASPSVHLNDIQEHWAKGSISKLVDLGAIDGYPDSSFKPDRPITRAEFTTVLVKAFKLAPHKGKIFKDTAGYWAESYIMTASNYGIVDGYSDGSFDPDASITREQMTVMTVRAAKLSSAPREIPFTDSLEISEWAKDAVANAVKNGIVNGLPGNVFKPRGIASRAEAVTVIAKSLNLQ